MRYLRALCIVWSLVIIIITIIIITTLFQVDYIFGERPIFNMVHITELLGVSPGSKLCATFLNIAKYFTTMRCGYGAVYFFNLLKTSTVTGFDEPILRF